MPAKKRSLLDSFAVLAFLNRERGFEKVRALLREAARLNQPLLMNEINLGEVYYVTAKQRSLERAEEFLHRLETLPIQPVPNSLTDVLDAARIKARFAISYADAFAVATAIRMNAAVVTGDDEFHTVSHLITIDWL
jgi:predicted nucleic acid-binding protein